MSIYRKIIQSYDATRDFDYHAIKARINHVMTLKVYSKSLVMINIHQIKKLLVLKFASLSSSKSFVILKTRVLVSALFVL